MPTTKKATKKMSTKKPVKKMSTSRNKTSVISTGMSKTNGVEKSQKIKGDLSTSLPTGQAGSRGRNNNAGLSNATIMGLFHLIGGVLGSRGWLVVIVYYVIKRESFTPQDTAIFYNIINFNLSFLLYAIISGLLVVILIGIPMLAAVYVTYIILLVISSLNYIANKPYQIPFSIQILK